MDTYTPKAKEIKRQWHVIDASNQVLGRLATRVAALLRGKHKAMFTPFLDTGDYVVVLNAAKVMVTGKKAQGKIYYRHTQYPGGLRQTTFAQMLAAHPERVIELAVKRMLPQNRLGRAMYKKLKVYPGPTHPHAGQVREEQP